MKTTVLFAMAMTALVGASGQGGLAGADRPPSAWHQAAPHGGGPTWFSAAFAIGDKGFVVTGYDSANALWQYDATAGAWTRKADFPGRPRGAAVAFSLGGRGYVGTGFKDDTRFADLWEYDPAADRWTGKAPLPGRPRDHAAAFVVGRRAFVAGGMACNGTDCADLKEVWEYDAASDRWTAKADMPEEASAAACFVVGGKAYLAGGRSGAGFTRRVLEYDPQADRWARKADFPGPTRLRGIGFSADAKGYVVTGLQSVAPASAAVLGDAWEYTPQTDRWTERTDLAGPARGAGVGFAVGSRIFVGTGAAPTRDLLADFWWADPARRAAAANGARGRTLPPAVTARIDALVKAKIGDCRSLTLGIVNGGKVVLTRAYAEGRLSGEYEYGSVSKPVTATIVLRLLAEGRIKSLDDNVSVYLPRYSDAMPAAYKSSPLTLKHLLTHRSGIPHNDEPPLVDGRFNLKFQPGARMLYSTPGYGMLGQVIEAVTGLAYSDAVRTYIGEPVGARSMRAQPSFIAPGAFVTSNIEDMARFAIGVMNGQYVSTDVLYREAWRPESGSYGYGWSVENLDREDLTVGHGGSNGLPRAHLLIRPHEKSAVVVLAEMRVMAPLDLQELAKSVLAIAR